MGAPNKIGAYRLTRGVDFGSITFWHKLNVCGIVMEVHISVDLYGGAIDDMNFRQSQSVVEFYYRLPGGTHGGGDNGLFTYDEEG